MNLVQLRSIAFQPTAFLSGAPGPWAGHLPFAYDLVSAIRPGLIVELGVYLGDSYFAFCQAASENKLACTCYGVDTWRGDSQGGFYGNLVYEAVSRYNEDNYASFSYLVRGTFDHALAQFSDSSVDILHIDGFHTYDAVRHDFDCWYPKVRPGGIILLHDIAVRSSDFGVWRLWEELQERFRCFTFSNSNGLGVVWKPEESRQDNTFLTDLFFASEDDRQAIRRYYSACGEHIQLKFNAGGLNTAEAGHSLFQVFSSRGDEYRNEGVDRMVEAAKWQKITVRLPLGIGEGPLRIDPTNRPAMISLSAIALRRLDGTITWSWHEGEDQNGFRVAGTASQFPSRESVRILSYGVDPQIYLPGAATSNADEPVDLELRVLIDLEFGSLGDFFRRLSAVESECTAAEQKYLSQISIVDEYYRKRERDFEAQSDAWRQQLQQIRDFQLSLISDREHLYEVNGQLSKQLNDVQQDTTRLQECCEDRKADVNRLNAAYESVSAALSEEKRIRANLEHSRSWKLTRPLRTLVSFFRGTL